MTKLDVQKNKDLTDFQKLELSIEDNNIRLETSINSQTKNDRHEFIIKSEIYKNDQIVSDIDKLDRKELSEIVKKYKIKTDEVKEEDLLGSDSSNSSLVSIDAIKRTFLGLKVALNTLNVITVDQQEQSIVRTTVELDADIITVLKQDLKIKKNCDLFLDLHGTNVLLVNAFFKMYLFKVTKEIKKWIKRGKIVSGLGLGSILPAISGASSLLDFSPEVLFIGLLSPLPGILGYKYGQKIARRLILKKVRNSLS